MLTVKGYIFTSAALALVGAGVFTDNPLLSLASIPIISYLVFGRLFSNPPHCDVAVKRVCNLEKVVRGEQAVCTVYLENKGAQVDFLEVYDVLPREFKLKEGSNRFVLSLPQGGKTSFTYSFEATSTGFFKLGPVVLKSTDGSGFFEQVKATEVESWIRALPTVEQVRANLRLIKLRNWPGEVVSRKAGSGLDFHSIREYQPGDIPKRVNWKAYAKHQRMFTNQYSAELGGEVMIVLDARKQHSESLEYQTLDLSASAAATIALALLRERNRVGLMVMGDILEKVYPATGRRQLDRILLLLSSFAPGNRWKISMVAHYLKLLFSRITDVIIVTASPDEQVLAATSTLCNQGYSVTVVSSYPKFVEDTQATAEVNELASQILRMKREAALRNIRKYAIVIEQEGDRPMAVALQERSIRLTRMRVTRS